MTHYLETQLNKQQCPYCNAAISLLIDTSLESQQYIEDCEVCCRPINIRVVIDMHGNCDTQVQLETLDD